jgi:hypothetical protein
MAARALILFSFVIVALGGCATASPKIDDGELASLKAEGKGIVLIHTTLNDIESENVSVTLARPDGAGRYRVWRAGVPIKFSLDSSKVPGQLKLPAGEYAIVELHAVDLRENRHFTAQDPKLEGMLLTKVYERPIALIKVESGEVVDVGSLRVIEGRRETTLLGQKSGFTVSVTQMPEPMLRNLAERNPILFNARVTRPMTVPAQSPQNG